MAIALLTFSSLFAPLQAFFAVQQRRGSRIKQQPVCAQASRTRAVQPLAAASCVTRAPAAARPLRVLRVVEPHSRDTGRLVISGRMADVCAELDRLAALEAAAR